MAAGKNGYFDLACSISTFSFRVNWSETYDIDSNTSTFQIDSIQIRSSGYYGYTYYPDGIIKINGETVLCMDSNSGQYSVRIERQNTWIGIKKSGSLAVGSVEVPHNNDGTKKITVEILPNRYDLFRFYTSDGAAGSGWSVSGTKEIELTTIPRASTISATDANIGAVSMIAVNKKSSSYTHSIKYEFGSLRGYVTADGVSSSEVKLSQTSIGFTIPGSFYAELSDAKSMSCTLTCTTYSESAQIGEATTTQFTVTAAQDVSAPSVSGTIVDVNNIAVGLTGNSGRLIRFVSTARCTITATAKNSATISEKKINGVIVTKNTLDIANVEFGTIPFYAKDSRGYETTVNVSADIVPYVVLTSNPRIVRTEQASGKAVLYIDGNYYSGSFGSKSNTLTITAEYKSGGKAISITATPVIGKDGEYSVEEELNGLEYDSTYTFTITVSDRVSTIEKTVRVGRGIPVFDWGQSDFYFNVLMNMNANRITGLANPIGSTDAVPFGYVRRKISVTSSGKIAIGDTFILSENIINKNPVFAMLNYTQTMGRVGGNAGNRTIAFHSVTESTSGVYICFALFGVSDDGLTLTLNSAKQVLIKADGIVVSTDVSFQFGEVTLII